jgi:hypothetical protein
MTTPPFDFQGATALVLSLKFDPEGEQASFSVDDPQEVRRMVSLINLEERGELYCVPMCQHVLTVTFHMVSSSVEVDFCQTCFGRYPMPEAFYQEFRKLAVQHGWRELDPICWTARHH